MDPFKKFRFSAFFLALACLVCFTQCEDGEDPLSDIAFLKMYQHSSSVYIAATQQLYAYAATALPQDSSEVISWKSSNTAVVTVNQKGLISGIGEGEATVTATAGGKSDTCHITVTSPLLGLWKSISIYKAEGSEDWTPSVNPDNFYQTFEFTDTEHYVLKSYKKTDGVFSLSATEEGTYTYDPFTTVLSIPAWTAVLSSTAVVEEDIMTYIETRSTAKYKYILTRQTAE